MSQSPSQRTLIHRARDALRVKLTPEQRTSLGRIMKERVGEFPPCSVCRNPSGWTIGGSLVAPEGAGPFVTFSCTKCGHTLHFHARVLGLLPGGQG